MLRTPRVTALVVLLLLVPAALGGCDGDEPATGSAGSDRGSRFAAQLEDLPGVVSAEVFEPAGPVEDIEQMTVDVVVADDATEPQVTAVLDAAAAQDRRIDLEAPHQMTLAREDDPGHPLRYEDRPTEPTAELVRRWTVAEQGLDPALEWSADGYGGITVLTGRTAGAADIDAVVDAVRADPDLAALPRWSISSGEGVTLRRLSTERGLTDRVAASWDAAVAGVRSAPPGTALLLEPSNDPAGGDQTHPPGSMRLTVWLSLPGTVRPPSLTPARWGDRLMPLLRAEVAVLRGLPRSSRFEMSNSWTTPDGSEGDVDFLVVLAQEGEAQPERPDRGWTRAALGYLDGPS